MISHHPEKLRASGEAVKAYIGKFPSDQEFTLIEKDGAVWMFKGVDFMGYDTNPKYPVLMFRGKLGNIPFDTVSSIADQRGAINCD
ncbi:TPA: hypothetical protein DHW58_02285 [Patescibacteria group bacterium]|uniref:Uncharacterized protein n=2 Tax=Bacteria division Kazan-3B-28 TaxID=1798534 RepID=A0A0G1X7J4_UNCK3|nr:MAG: hypothetical protein VE98_C0001G0235 [candidate division Kazan bacterium GW2011_GWA1_50_15]KKW25489.1 MAG: hypothetical protein VE99_C0001G0126 [candidate division Kazan bacterium GW2011_GWC1_52_13]KKW26795.1 MAG: hypothetical protein VF00_C0002G0120 [candidate division Kazan bacterium GW2011_GWB1_52_7]HAV65790.1 hypothetical protein [Patescibacteria group bacterium]HCL47797.1 hypothetical protein [Patescibacteria group bacterium]